jgi:hypothetical protein
MRANKSHIDDAKLEIDPSHHPILVACDVEHVWHTYEVTAFFVPFSVTPKFTLV